MVVEFKNLTNPPNQEEIEFTAKYLYKKAKRSFGILCTRQPASKSALDARRKVWSEAEKLIVLLCDDDLRNMLRIKAANANPEQVIERHIYDFFMPLKP